jgi:RNA polymerase primary sigma factor
MAIHSSTKVNDIVHVGMEKRFLGSDEINDFVPREFLSPEDAQDVFDFLSESVVDIVETMQGKDGTGKEKSPDDGEIETSPSETADNIV